MKISSNFALLDVKNGRAQLAKHFDAHKAGPQGISSAPQSAQIPVVIAGYLVAQWGSDDGESIEFQVDVTAVRLGEPGGQQLRDLEFSKK